MNQRHSSPADTGSGRERLIESTLELLAFEPRTHRPAGVARERHLGVGRRHRVGRWYHNILAGKNATSCRTVVN